VKDFCCSRCGRWVETGYPSGQPLVSLRVERVYHQARRDLTRTAEPAGVVTALLCLGCADALWARLREALGGN
jgi:hypothetical protein